MPALAFDGDVKFVARGHHRPRAHGKVAHGHAGPVVHAKHRLHREALEQAVRDHLTCSAAAFFGGLEDQVHRAVEVAVPREVVGRREQHRRVAVVAAGVHTARMAARVRKAVCLVDGQRVHVGAQPDGAPAGTAVAPVHDADHAGLAQAAVHGNAPFAELLRHEVGGAQLLEAQLGMCVQVAAQRRKAVCLGSDGFDDVHGVLSPAKGPQLRAALRHEVPV